ncbi:flagellar hook protein FlgE [Novosphingobium sp. JCM 18896]|uniref:flagellar hook protein FlgE n=1 Tax=Novosphingobium sp. JCM 18896 TaxID=2989731 RepID=UPI0022237DEE|nr:flagellar hook-basal body complex protein [Novosphingobium sp. JCM 18896]MCW1428832.1 flagellar hook-basal body complex protein [Novosphingobium sp. JCM 18896]
MSFYTSLSGLKNAQTGLGVTANNIANAETLGFKKSRTLFADLVTGTNPKMQMGIGSTVQSITQTQSMGPIEQTGGALDMAINGDGFFTKVNPISGETMYTRSGAFSVDDNGFVKDGAGNRLQIFAADADGKVQLDANGKPVSSPVSLQLPSKSAPSPFASAIVTANGSAQVTYENGTTESIALPKQSTPSAFASSAVNGSGTSATITATFADGSTQLITPAATIPAPALIAEISGTNITYKDAAGKTYTAAADVALPATNASGSARASATPQANGSVLVYYNDGTSESIAPPTMAPFPLASVSASAPYTATYTSPPTNTDVAITLPTESTASAFASATVVDGKAMVTYANGAVESIDLPTQAPAAAFAGVTVDKDGMVRVSFADGKSQSLGKVALAQFSAVDGLKQTGSSNWVATGLSGDAEYGLPGGGTFGGLSSGSLERSNVDITEELVGLITMQRYFQANAKAIDTASQISQTVLNLRT